MATSPFIPKLDYVPPPPPLPKYDPKEEPPMWDMRRLRWNVPVDKGLKEWTPIGTQPASSSDPDWRGVIKDNVREFPMPTAYNFGQANDTSYFWFDTPDYADPFKKLRYAAYFFTKTGLCLACVKGFMEGRRSTLVNNLYLLRSFFGPWLLSGMAASITVVTIANLRGKKDDVWNYVPAGYLFGALMGRKNAATFFRGTVTATPAAAYFKYNAEYNGQLMPSWNFFNRRYGWEAQSGEDGVGSGDFRFGFRGTTINGDPGRDVRTWK